jgi:hypothetical protein
MSLTLVSVGVTIYNNEKIAHLIFAARLLGNLIHFDSFLEPNVCDIVIKTYTQKYSYPLDCYDKSKQCIVVPWIMETYKQANSICQRQLAPVLT